MISFTSSAFWRRATRSVPWTSTSTVDAPEARSYRIVDGTITEEPIAII